MPLPAFDGILNVLPPHLGDPRDPSQVSPYNCNIIEVCQRFATTPARIAILQGFLEFRKELLMLGINGFQWLDGSFLEDIEMQEGRAPKDIDVITFVTNPAKPEGLGTVLSPRPELFHHDEVKARFFVDHFWISLGSEPIRLIETTRYWYGLFSHRRDGVWKGMAVTQLSDPSENLKAVAVLEALL